MHLIWPQSHVHVTVTTHRSIVVALCLGKLRCGQTTTVSPAIDVRLVQIFQGGPEPLARPNVVVAGLGLNDEVNVLVAAAAHAVDEAGL